jgi:2-polyprenyl-3-methyl-5-hydroxy-6-metoxy-1,4-benzoquinol methylase
MQTETQNRERGNDKVSWGKAAEFESRIVTRRVSLVRQIDGFIDRNLTLVDLGCGNGASTFMLAGEMSRCVGIDMNPAYQKIFREQMDRNSVRNCEFVLLDLNKDSYHERFDRLISFEVIEHLKDEGRVRVFHDLLKPGGLAAITVPNKWWIFETHGANLPLLPWNRVPYFSWLPRGVHERFARARIYTKKRIHDLLSTVGFDVIHMSYVTAPMDVLGEGWLKSFLTKYVFHQDETPIPFLATAIFVIVGKRNKGELGK